MINLASNINENEIEVIANMGDNLTPHGKLYPIVRYTNIRPITHVIYNIAFYTITFIELSY